MPSIQRTTRINSLLKDVLSEVVRKDVKNPNVSEFVTITKVDITRDLHNAKVFVSVIAEKKEKETTLLALQSAAKFISFTASKKVVLRYFPKLQFFLDDSVENHVKIQTLLDKVNKEKELRENNNTGT